MTPDEIARLKHLAEKHRGAVRHDLATIVRVKTLLLFPRIGISAIAQMTGVSPSTIKRTKAEELHSRVQPSRIEAEQIARELNYPMPEIYRGAFVAMGAEVARSSLDCSARLPHPRSKS